MTAGYIIATIVSIVNHFLYPISIFVHKPAHANHKDFHCLRLYLNNKTRVRCQLTFAIWRIIMGALQELEMSTDKERNLGRILHQRRVSIPLTLREVAKAAGISSSHLGRIERGERFPSARILRRLAKPLGFDENELFTLAGYLSDSPGVAEEETEYVTPKLDPYVARVLAQEPPEVQRSVIAILTTLKGLAKGMQSSKEE